MMKTFLFIGELLTIISHSPLLIMGRHNTIINVLKIIYYVCCLVFASLRSEYCPSPRQFIRTAMKGS